MSVLTEKKEIISIKEARKKLGAKYKSLSDEMIRKLIKELEVFAEISIKVGNAQKQK